MLYLFLLLLHRILYLFLLLHLMLYLFLLLHLLFDLLVPVHLMFNLFLLLHRVFYLFISSFVLFKIEIIMAIDFSFYYFSKKKKVISLVIGCSVSSSSSVEVSSPQCNFSSELIVVKVKSSFIPSLIT